MNNELLTEILRVLRNIEQGLKPTTVFHIHQRLDEGKSVRVATPDEVAASEAVAEFLDGVENAAPGEPVTLPNSRGGSITDNCRCGIHDTKNA